MSIHAPYNFVPLSAWIYKPEWGHLVSHDLPFSDGISGTLNIEIRAETPLLVGGHQKPATEHQAGEVRFYQTPDGTYAIPGSSLKGMIRNVLEIAAFGKMRAVDDRTLSVRDLTRGGEFYRQWLTKDLGNRTYQPLAKAGWLRMVPGKDGGVEWRLTPCRYVRVEHNDLIAYATKQGISNPPRIKQKQSAARKYRLWGEDRLGLRFSIETNQKWQHQRGNITLVYEKATAGLGNGDRQGTLVFTGQPGEDKGKGGVKHMEFIFYQADEAGGQTLDDKLISRFRETHADSEEWHYWRDKLYQQEGVPVFYLERGNRVHSLGLAMMYRLAYEHSIHETLAHTNPGHVDDTRDNFFPFDPAAPRLGPENRLYDLPELLFGTVHDQKTEYSLRSRVSFATARLHGEAETDSAISRTATILNGPKPGYYPAYVRQPADAQLREHQPYRTYMDKTAEVRGWKRYPVNPRWEVFSADKAGGGRVTAKSEKAKIRLFPLKKGACFQGTITVHNLRPAELGALVWALTWDDNPALRHSLGMGKPYGLGQVRVTLHAGHNLAFVNPARSEETPDLAECRRRFTQCMEAAWITAAGSARWADSEQLAQLQAMADPGRTPPAPLEYMPLPRFQQEKNQRNVLPPYADHGGPADTVLFPRVSEEERARREHEAQQQREAAARAAEIAQQLAALDSELERDLHKDLVLYTHQSEAEKSAAGWVDKMEQAEEARLIATKVKDFYVAIGKWPGDSKKQKEKVKRVKAVLGG